MLASVQRFRNFGTNKEIKIQQDSDHDAKINTFKHNTVKIIEIDYLKGTPIYISKDIYDLTVGANYTGVFTPIEQSYSFGKCILCFVIQMMMIYGFVRSSLEFDKFQPFLTRQVFLRFFLCVLF